MSLAQLLAASPENFDVLSLDLFDAVLLRDHSLQRQRFAEISAVAATLLRQSGHAIEPQVLTSLRTNVHTLSYRSAAIERPAGDAALKRIHALQGRLLGLPDDCQPLLREAELMVECKRLRANQPLLAVLRRFASAGKRIVATSDTYYSSQDLEWLLGRIVRCPSPIMRQYSSSDIGLTKHPGGLFVAVAEREQVEASRILHRGDDLHADIKMANAAGCQTIHLPRPALVRVVRKANAVQYAVTHAATIRSAA
jgi:FMN phosphatase YigB (HAD superfamily)